MADPGFLTAKDERSVNDGQGYINLCLHCLNFLNETCVSRSTSFRGRLEVAFFDF